MINSARVTIFITGILLTSNISFGQLDWKCDTIKSIKADKNISVKKLKTDGSLYQTPLIRIEGNNFGNSGSWPIRILLIENMFLRIFLCKY